MHQPVYLQIFKLLCRQFGIFSAAAILTFGLPVSSVFAQTDDTTYYYLSRAINSLTNNNYTAAEKHFISARDADGNSADINLKIAELYIGYAASEHSKALPFLRTALEQNPTLDRAQLLMGQVHFLMNNYTETIKALEKIDNDSEYHGNASYYLGIVSYRQARFRSALTYIGAVVDNPDLPALHESAKNYIDAIGHATKPWNSFAVATVRHDSTPQLEFSDELANTASTTGKHDNALLFQGQSSITLLQNDYRKLSTSYLLYDMDYRELDSLDQQGHILGLDAVFFGRVITTGVLLNFEHWIVNGDRYQQIKRISTSLSNKLTASSKTEWGYQYSHVERDDIPSRSGPKHKLSLNHTIEPPHSWRVSMAFNREFQDTKEALKSRRNEISVDIFPPTFRELQFQLGGRYSDTRFSGISATGHRDNEKKGSARLAASRVIGKNVRLHLSATHEDTSSDAADYNYSRQHTDVGIVLTF